MSSESQQEPTRFKPGKSPGEGGQANVFEAGNLLEFSEDEIIWLQAHLLELE